MSRLLALFLSLILSPTVAVPQQQSNRPRLVVIIVADQFRYDYLTRFAPLFGQGGFRRLMHDGAVWTNANYDYVPTKTAPGHSAIVTGAAPSRTGIAGNEWVDRGSRRRVTAVGDPSAKVLGGGPKESANSPHRLLASTIGDELRGATSDRAKVIGVSDKPRAAILPAGKRANAAYWLSSDVGTIISSTYYFSGLPTWVQEMNRTSPLNRYFNARWDRLLGTDLYERYAGADAPPWEVIDAAPGETNKFPHWVNGGAKSPNTAFYNALDHSPFVNDVIVSVAEAAITNEHLGADEVTDLLTVSLSGSDHVGHRFGPYSQEVMDVALRTDRQIEGLLSFIDAKVGLDNTLVVFSSDHGVSPLFEQSRVDGKGGLLIRTRDVMKPIHDAIRARYPGHANDYILQYREAGVEKDAILNGQVYFDGAALSHDGIDLDEVTKLAGEASLKVAGIAHYFTSGEIERCLSGQCAADPILRLVARGFFPGRSGDLIIVQKPFNYLGDADDPANHGTPYSYDTHVPLIMMGQGIKHGRYNHAATPRSIAPTLAFILGIPAPNKSDARVLREALISRDRRSEVGGQRPEISGHSVGDGRLETEVRSRRRVSPKMQGSQQTQVL